MVNKDVLVREHESIKSILKKLDKTALKILLVVDGRGRLAGTITDGDVRRYLLKNNSLESDIKKIYNRKPRYISQNNFSLETAKKIMFEYQIQLIPLVDKKKKIVDLITWRQAYPDSREEVPKKSMIKIPVVIMAGGKGERLSPLTKILPKPLIPLGDRTVIEIIIGNFMKQGLEKFYIILNYKSKIIKMHLDSIKKSYKTYYVNEKKELGTAGGLKLLSKTIADNFIVSNCDVIVKADFGKILKFHKEQKAELTVISSVQYYKIPYGVIDYKSKGRVTDILEKPEHAFTINTGVYILSKKSLQFIPKNSHFNMTELIKQLIKNNKKVCTYSIGTGGYIDVGQWKEYKEALDRPKLLE